MTGNCLQAAIASLLDLQLDDVPNFAAIEGEQEDQLQRRPWLIAVENWLAEHGFGLVSVQPSMGAYCCPGTHVLLHGPSPRGDFMHTVVGLIDVTGEILFVHDPHPSDAFLANDKIEEIWAVAVR